MPVPLKAEHYSRIADIIQWVLSQSEDPHTRQLLPFVFRFGTMTEQRNDLARRILRISQSDPLFLLHNTQDYWVSALVSDEVTHQQSEDMVDDLVDQLAQAWT